MAGAALRDLPAHDPELLRRHAARHDRRAARRAACRALRLDRGHRLLHHAVHAELRSDEIARPHLRARRHGHRAQRDRAARGSALRPLAHRLERNRFTLNRDFALSSQSHDLVRKVCNFSGSCSGGYAMAEKLRLTVACGDYEIVRALKEGAVTADGLDLVMLTGMGPRERHWRMARKAEFDVCEANVGAYFMERDHGAAALASEASGQRGNSIVRAPDTRPEPGSSARVPLTAIPVFLHRRFRHGFLFVNAEAGIRAPKDLIGKKVGGTNFQPASNIWMRGILEEEYALPHRQVTWVVERSEDVAFTPPKDLRIEMIAPGKTLDVMLAEGEIPAMLSPELPRLFLAGDKRIVRLFPDYKEVELAYFRRTGIFPIMHVTTIKQEIVDKYPWVPTNLVKAFEQAKNIAYRRIANPRMVPIAWVRTALEEQEAVLGPDPWAYGLTPANRKNLETVLRYTFQQGMISRMPPLDTLFADTDLGDAGGPDGI